MEWLIEDHSIRVWPFGVGGCWFQRTKPIRIIQKLHNQWKNDFLAQWVWCQILGFCFCFIYFLTIFCVWINLPIWLGVSSRRLPHSQAARLGGGSAHTVACNLDSPPLQECSVPVSAPTGGPSTLRVIASDWWVLELRTRESWRIKLSEREHKID